MCRLVAVLLSARAIFFFLTLSVLMLAGNAFNFWQLMPVWAAFLFWPGIFSIYIVLLLLQYFLVAALTNRQSRAVVISPLVGFICLSAALFLCNFCATHFSGDLYPGMSVKEYILFYMVSQMVEVLFAQFMASPNGAGQAFSGGDAAQQSLPPKQQPATLVMGDVHLPISDLKVLEADEHYVRIETTNGDMLKRVRMSDLLAQLGPEQGLRPHRSWWVSRMTQPELKKHHGRQVLELKCGAHIPVARGRLGDVRDWLELHNLSEETFANEVSKSP